SSSNWRDKLLAKSTDALPSKKFATEPKPQITQARQLDPKVFDGSSPYPPNAQNQALLIVTFVVSQSCHYI
uniref:hypothetical protein n=1 Tax=uncultured Ruegeria sp. TaxID=259304 RepID=UPI0026283DB0